MYLCVPAFQSTPQAADLPVHPWTWPRTAISCGTPARTSFDQVGLGRQKLNRGAAAHLRRCAEAVERGDRLSAPPTRPTVYTAPKRHSHDRLTDDEIDRLIASYRGGAGRSDLAEQFGISVSTIARLLRRRGIRRRWPKALRS